jgi:membrane protein required for colicin V production
VNWLDVLILLILGVEMLLGWRAGLVGMIAQLGGFILGLFLAARYSGAVADALGHYLVGSPLLLRAMAFLALFLAGRYGLALAGEFVKRALAVPGLAAVDRLAGAGLGLAIGTLVVILLVSFLTWLPWPGLSRVVQESELGQYFWSAAPVFGRFFWGELAPGLLHRYTIPGGQQVSCPLSSLTDREPGVEPAFSGYVS